MLDIYSMIVYDEAINALRRIAKVQNKKVLAVVETGGSLNRKGTTYLPFYLQQKVNTKFILYISRTPFRY